MCLKQEKKARECALKNRNHFPVTLVAANDLFMGEKRNEGRDKGQWSEELACLVLKKGKIATLPLSANFSRTRQDTVACLYL